MMRRVSCSTLAMIGRLALGAVTILAAAAAPAADDDQPVLLKPDRVFTAEDDKTRSGWAVLVEGDRIAAVGPTADLAVPPGTQLIELPGATLLPGLIDLHVHLFLHPYNETLWGDQVLKEPLEYRTIAAVEHAAATLAAGFTTVRDLGTEGAGYADVSLRRALEEGRIPGPRLEISTLAIAVTGDPAADIAALEDVRLVMQGGRIVKHAKL